MINGFLNLNKERGMTSSQAVGKCKGILRSFGLDYGKIGHMGTLDPDGEGVLPIALGRATRLFDLLSDKIKVYETVFRFGCSTDTLDGSGKILAYSTVIPTEEQILAVIPRLVGEIDQVPPDYSAKSVNGVRAYRLARAGAELALKPRRVVIHEICLLSRVDETRFRFRVTCGGGTYIRSLARDMAKELGTLGVMDAIRRTRSGPFFIEEARTLEELSRDPMARLIPIRDVLHDCPVLELPCGQVKKRFYDGIPLSISASDGLYQLCDAAQTVGIGRVEGGTLQWVTRLF